jgi:uncharacterized membrane protein
MSNAPVELIVAAFPGEHDAEEALKQIKAARKEKLIGILNVAVLRRDAKNKLHIKETADMRGGKGAAIGAGVGAAVGLLFPPSVLFSGAVGAGIGALAAKLRDSGFPDGELRALGEGLTPGTSAVVALIEHTWVADVERELAEEGAKVVRQAMAGDIRTQLEAGHSLAYSALASDSGVALSRASVGEDAIEVEYVAVDEDGVTLAVDSIAATEPKSGETPAAEPQA